LRKPQKADTTVGNLIKQTRKSMGMSQMRLAGKIGVSYQQVQKYEKGTSQLTIVRLKQFAKALGISVHSFVEDEPTSASKVSYKGLNAKEIRLITLYRKTSSERVKDRLINLIEALASGTKTR
jgi:transcriptional regulator with XRE-family HTH domain